MSNLLKKASIITTPTAYDDGRILSVKPSENLYGSELITNGDFATDSDWTKGTGWTISGGTATYDGTGGTSSMVQGNIQNIQLGKNCKVTLDVLSNEGNGANTIFLGGTVLSSVNLSVGSHTFYGSFTSNTNFYIYGRSGEVLEIDNVSVVEDLSGDFNFERGSAATRVNAQGLVENVQILSSELVQNGNFSEIGSEEVSNGDFSQEGSEEIVNGDFATDSDWTKGTGWYISGGTANCDGTQTGNTNLTQGGVFSSLGNKNIKISFTVSNYVAGSVRFISGNGALTHIAVSTNGVVNLYFNVGGNTATTFNIQGDADFIGSIDNVSVVEVGQDWLPKFNGTGDWYITDKLNFENVNGGSRQNNVFVIGKTYKITLDYVFTSGTRLILPYDGSNFPSDGKITSPGSATGYTYYYTPISNTSLNIYSDGNGTGSVDNISVKEVLQDWEVADYGAVNPSAVITPSTEGVKLEKTVSADWRSSFLVQPISYTIGSKYKVTFKLKNGNLPSGGDVFVRSKYSSSSQTIASNIVLTNDWVEYTYHYEADSNSFDISFGEVNWQNAGVGEYFYIDNVSVVEITDDTDLPRINYEGFSYQDVLGSELITNGDFAVDGSWVKGTGWTISGGSLNALATTTATFQQNTGIVTNKTYKVTYTISNYVSGSVRIEIGSANVSVGAVRSANGTYTEYITALGDDEVYFDGLSAFTGSIDNVSVKEYLGQQVVPNSGCGSWLFEPQSTNIFDYSSDLSAWSKLNSTVSESSVLSLDGVNNSYVYERTSSSSSYIYRAVSLSNTTVYTLSFFAKIGTSTNVRTDIWDTTQSTQCEIQVDLATKTVSNFNGTSYKIEDYTNGWMRISVTFTSESSFGTTFNRYFNADSVGTELYIWGAQLEQKSYATSYIPTDGATSTRLQDIANNSGNSDLISSTEGVLYAEIATNEDTINKFISLSDGTDDNRVTLYVHKTTNDEITCQVKNNNSEQFSRAISVNVLDFNKAAISFKENLCKFFVNGLQVGTTDTSAILPSGLNTLEFAKGDKNEKFFGKTKAVAVWKEALTDTELELLTAPTPEFPTFSLDFDTIAEQFTFTRGSEATFVNEQGLIQSTNELGAELVTNGNFATDSDWTKDTGWTISGGQANCDGTDGAQLRTINTPLTNGKTYYISFEITSYSSGDIELLGQSLYGISGNSVSIVKGIFVATKPYVRFYSSAFNGSIDNVSVKEVITATNTPRIDYSTGVEAFLLEPQSTNLVTYSEDLTNFSSSSLNVTINPNQTTSPSGNLADKIEENNVDGSHAIRRLSGIFVTASQDYTFSFFAKKDERSIVGISNTVGGNDANAFIDIENGVILSSDFNNSSIDDYGNGWYRISLTDTATNTTDYDIRIYTSTQDGNFSHQGVVGYGFYIWGISVEQQSYATSYIPTDGASATRNQETCVDATPTINSEEGVLYAEIAALADDNTLKSITLSDGTTSNRVIINYSNQSNRLTADVRVNSVGQAFMQTFSYTITNFNKIAIKYKENDFALWVNGTEVATDTSGLVFPSGTLNKLNFDNGSGGEKLYGNTKGLQVFDKALSDYQLKQLTTI